MVSISFFLDSGVISQMLNYVDLLTITNSECAKAYGDEIFDGMVCAISGSDSVKSPCSVSSGTTFFLTYIIYK